MTETSSLRPRPSCATTADDSASQYYASAHSYLRDTTGEEDSMWTAPSYAFDDERPSAMTNAVEVLATPPKPHRPPFVSNPSSVSTTSCASSSSSSSSEVDMSGPLTSPFFLAPRLAGLDPAAPRRPTSPLPPVPVSAPQRPPPPAKNKPHHLRGPATTSHSKVTNAPYRAPPLTDHNSLAAFQAAASSEDSHRTSSDVDLDLSFDYDPTRRGGSAGSHESGYSTREDVRSSSEGEGEGEGEEGQGSLERLEDAVMKGGWVGIEMRTRPHAHGIPEGQLVRSGSGKLVGARASRARSAVDLRAQFRAAEEEAAAAVAAAHGALAPGPDEQDVSIVLMQDAGNVFEREQDRKRRVEIRAGKRPTEGERAGWTTLDRELLGGGGEDRHDAKPRRRRSAGVGFAYNATESLYPPPAPPQTLPRPPHSAPLRSEPVFASLQQQHHDQRPAHQVVDLSPFSAELDHAKRTKAFPLPLRLIDRSKWEAVTTGPAGTTTTTSPSPKLGSMFGARRSRQSLVYYDSDVASPEPSPLFDHHTDDEGGGGGTNQTAPSTPNDTPLFQECFSDEETTPPPVPDKDGALAGLGFDLDISDSSLRDEFPVVPLRRRSLPPAATAAAPQPVTSRRLSNRHLPIPSLSISPPPRTGTNEHALEDILETDSSRSSQDSADDPTVSPSRRISRRLSSSNPGLAGIGSASATGGGGATARIQNRAFTEHTTSTPPSDRGGATIITPQHLLVTPSDSAGTTRTSPNAIAASPSFSFSPAPLRLVKAQLLRAAGYRYDHVPTTASPPLGRDSPPPPPGVESSPSEMIHHATSSPRRKPATPQPRRENVDKDTATPARVAVPDGAGARLGKRTRVGTTLDELSDLLSSSAETWIDEVIPAKLAFIAGFLLGPWCWIIGGWYLRPQDGELPRSRGQRCRATTCNCGRILSGSTTRQRAQHTTTTTSRGTRTGRRDVDGDDDDWAGLDKWVFGNRVAACGGGVGIAVLVGVAIWAAASA
ncbi:hypothetical protein JCM11491_002739 [Sporobolomyces phaffii]